MAKCLSHSSDHPKLKGYADGGRVYSDSKTLTDNYQVPSIGGDRVYRSLPDMARRTDENTVVTPQGTRDFNQYPAYEDYVPGRVQTKKRKM